MAFFDDFGKKISNLGQSAVQKTKGVTYTAGLNSIISDEERNLNNCYCEIGRVYVQMHSTDPEPSLAEYVRAALQSENKLAAYRQQAQEARGMIRCPACGNHVTANSSFCNNCGFKLPPSQMNGMPVPPMNPQGKGMPVPPMNPQGKGMPMPSVNPQGNGMPVPPMNPQGNGMPVPPMNPQGKGMPVPPMNPQGKGMPMPSMNPQGNGMPVPPMNPQGKGMPMPSMNPQNSMTVNCSKCGAAMDRNLNFCTRCGTKLNKDVPTPNISENKSPFARNDKPDVKSENPEGNNNITPSDIIREKADISEDKKSDNIKCVNCGSDIEPEVDLYTECGAAQEKKTPQKPKHKVSLEKKDSKNQNISDKSKIKKSSTLRENLDDKPIIPHKTPEDKPLQEQPPENSTVPTVPPIIQENPTDNQPKKRMGIFIKKSKNSNNDIKPPISEVSPEPPMSQGQLSDNSPEPAMSQGQLSDNSPEPPMSQGQLSDNLPEPPMSQGQLSDNSPEPPMSQGQLSDNSPEPPMSQGQPSDNLPEPPMSQGQLSDNSPEPPMSQGQLSDNSPEPPMSQGQPSDNSPEPTKYDDKPNQNYDNFKTNFALSETALEFLNKKPEIPENDIKPEENKPLDNREVKCSNCGSVMSRGMKFCTLCGSMLGDALNTPTPSMPDDSAVSSIPSMSVDSKVPPIPPIPTDSDVFSIELNSIPSGMKKCGKCNSIVAASVRFCTSCGNRMSENIPEPSAKVNNAPFSKTKCGNCGAVFDSDMKFCTSCGSPLGNTPNTSATPSLSGLDGGTVYAVSSESVEEYGKPESILSENITSDNDYSSPLYSMPTVVLSHSPFEEEEVDSAPTINLDGQMCPNCKSIMASDMLFCTECGTRL